MPRGLWRTHGGEVDLPLERGDEQRGGRVGPAPGAQVNGERQVALRRGAGAQVLVTEVGVVQRQEHREGGEVADVHAHRLARRRIPAVHWCRGLQLAFRIPFPTNLLSGGVSSAVHAWRPLHHDERLLMIYLCYSVADTSQPIVLDSPKYLRI